MLKNTVSSAGSAARKSSGKPRSGTIGPETQKGVSRVFAKGTPALGSGGPGVNMPANNSGTFPVKQGSGIKSKFAQKQSLQSAKSKNKGVNGVGTGRPNMPANNTTNKSFSMGTTKHGKGQVPKYLRNTNNSTSC